jgi:hypothetical protein
MARQGQLSCEESAWYKLGGDSSSESAVTRRNVQQSFEFRRRQLPGLANFFDIDPPFRRAGPRRGVY